MSAKVKRKSSGVEEVGKSKKSKKEATEPTGEVVGKKKEKTGKENKAGKSQGKKDKLNNKAKGQGKPPAKSSPKEPSEKDKKSVRDKQKSLRHERKKKDSSVFELGVRAKQLWEKARSHDTAKDEMAGLVRELHASLKGQVSKVVHAHDTVRVVEFLMAKGDQPVRQELFDELKEELVSLSKSKYASFFVQKVLSYGTKEQKQIVVKKMEGKVTELTKHKVANAIVETVYNEVANASQRNCLVQEFFGPEFRLWKEPELRTAASVAEKHPLKEKTMTRSLMEHSNVLIAKGCYNQSLVHTVLWNYMQLLNRQVSLDDAKARTARAELIVQLRDVCVHVLHSRDGTRLSMNALWHGTAKDRKSVLKSFKGYVGKICSEEHGHAVLLAALDCVDDTKLVAKAVLGEMTTSLGDAFASGPGRKVLTYVVAGRDTTHFHPDYLAILERGDGNEHSRKDGATRRKELAGSFQDALFSFLKERLQSVVGSPHGCLLLQAALNSELVDQPKATPLLAEVAKMAATRREVAEDAAFHRLAKKLVAMDGERRRRAEEMPSFSGMLVDELTTGGDHLRRMLTFNRGAFLLVAVLEAGGAVPAKALREKLEEEEECMKVVREGGACNGAKILLKKLTPGGGDDE